MPPPSVLGDVALPGRRDLYYGGDWHAPADGSYRETFSPSTGESLGEAAWAGPADVDRAVAAARTAFAAWRGTTPRVRAGLLREAARLVRAHGEELARIDAADGGNPLRDLLRDAEIAASSLDYFAGVASEVKGAVIPVDGGGLNYVLREPLGIVARIGAYNHPFMFTAMRAAAPLAAGNVVLMKASEQAPLSSLRLVEILGPLFPPGVFNVLSGGRECGEAIVAHPGIAKVGLIGSVATGRAIARSAADTLKRTTLELGGKNALVAFPDADPEAVAAAAMRGMNFGWCGQSCGSTSRLFLHEALHDAVVERVVAAARALRPGIPTRMDTAMGCLVNGAHRDRVLGFVASGIADGATLAAGGAPPDDPELAGGFFVEPTVFTNVRPEMRIAREEIFGPVLSVLRWSDEERMFEAVNGTEYGLTASIWTRDLATAHRAAARIEAGYVWVNGVGAHFMGAPFGGFKQSGLGREESIEEMLECTQLKNVNVALA